MASLAILLNNYCFRKAQKLHNIYAKYFLKEIYWQDKNNKQITNQQF